MFSLIPKTDTGLWLGPLLWFSPPGALLSIPGRLVRADSFLMVPVHAGCAAVTQTDSYALERVKIVDPQRISLISSLIVHTPHHTEHPVHSQLHHQVPIHSFSFCESSGLMASWNPQEVCHFVPLQTRSTVRGAFMLKIPTVSLPHQNANLNRK